MPCVSVSWSATTSTTCSQPSNARSRAWPAAGSRPRAVVGKVVGIDLGTTNSLVAYVDGGRPVVIRDEGGDALVPSVVSLGEDATIFVGREAQRRLLTAPSRSVYSVKRFMGRGIDDVKGEAGLPPLRVSRGPGRRGRRGAGPRAGPAPARFGVFLPRVEEPRHEAIPRARAVYVVMSESSKSSVGRALRGSAGGPEGFAPQAIETIRRAVIQARWDLSEVEETEIRIEPSTGIPAGYRKRITRLDFERLIRPLI